MSMICDINQRFLTGYFVCQSSQTTIPTNVHFLKPKYNLNEAITFKIRIRIKVAAADPTSPLYHEHFYFPLP